MKTFEELFENPFNPHLEIIHFDFSILDRTVEIHPKFEKNMQIQIEKTEEETDESKIEIKDLEPIFTVKDITPKKTFWRK